MPPKEFLEEEPNRFRQELEQSLQFVRDNCGVTEVYFLVTFPLQTCFVVPGQELAQENAFRGPADPGSGLGLRHEHNGNKGLNTGFFDGSQQFIEDVIPPATWKALLTRAGGESVSW